MPSTRLWILLAALVYLALQPPLAEANAALKALIEFQVQREPRLNGTEVQIITDNGNVVLTGQVRLLSQKMLYEQIAWQTRGTMDVDSEIRVNPETPISDQQLERAILAMAQRHEELRNLEVAVKDGVVIVHGTFTTASDVLLLKWRMAEIEGVVRILMDSQFLANAETSGS
jgi:osmotically-inducible protein OsmY